MEQAAVIMTTGVELGRAALQTVGFVVVGLCNALGVDVCPPCDKEHAEPTPAAHVQPLHVEKEKKDV